MPWQVGMHCRIQCPQGPMSSWLTTYKLPPSTCHLKPTNYNLKLPPTSYYRQGGSGKLYYFLEFKFLESDRPSASPVTGSMLSMKFCIEWCRDQGLLTRAPLGYFYNAPHWGGGLFRAPPLISETTGPILKKSSGIWKPWKNCRGKTNFIDLRVNSDVTGQVKVKMFDISGLVTSASKIAMLSTNKAN